MSHFAGWFWTIALLLLILATPTRIINLLLLGLLVMLAMPLVFLL